MRLITSLHTAGYTVPPIPSSLLPNLYRLPLHRSTIFPLHQSQIISTFVTIYARSKSKHDDNHTDYPLCF